MTKQVIVSETTPEELISRIATVIDKRIEALHQKNNKPEKPVQVTELAQFLSRSQNWERRETKLGNIPGHRKGQFGDFYYFLSEIVGWIKEGRIISNEEIKQRAEEYANNKSF